MKPGYIIVPTALVVAFGTCYAIWRSRARERAKAARRQSIDSLTGGQYRSRDGQKEAEADIAKGLLKLKACGLPSAGNSEWREVLKERFGVEVERIAGCGVSDPLLAYAEAYNVTVEHYLAVKYGATALEEAQKRFEARRDKKG